MDRSRKLKNTRSFIQKKELEYYYGIERARAKEKLDRI